MFKLFPVIAALCFLTAHAEARPAKKVTKADIIKKEEANAKAVEDNEDSFFQEEPEEEPLDENAEDENADYQKESPAAAADDIVESNQNPDDEGIEYAAEAEKNEAERKKKIEERKNALRKPRAPVDEPMPLIKRQREAVEISSKQGSKYIRHPNAKKGLTKITKDKIYIYNVAESDQTRASSIRLGVFTPSKLANPETGVSYDEFYPDTNFALQYDYEWQLFRKFGKAGLKVGTGLAVAQGSGQFKNDLNGGLTPKEKLTFVMLPNTAGAIVRLQFWDRQLLVPYGEGGGAAFGFAELRDDGKKPKFGMAFGGYFAVGAALNLHFLDNEALLELDREYSVNNVFVTGEYRYYVGTGNFDFTGDVISGGITMEF